LRPCGLYIVLSDSSSVFSLTAALLLAVWHSGQKCTFCSIKNAIQYFSNFGNCTIAEFGSFVVEFYFSDIYLILNYSAVCFSFNAIFKLFVFCPLCTHCLRLIMNPGQSLKKLLSPRTKFTRSGCTNLRRIFVCV
jgi:hypothetical protein